MSVLGVMAEHWFAIAVFFGAIVRRPLSVLAWHAALRLCQVSKEDAAKRALDEARRRLDDEKDDGGGSSQG
jgi:hypothetical protein